MASKYARCPGEESGDRAKVSRHEDGFAVL